VMMLAPALLVLVGKRGAFWIPVWATRVVPHIDIEGQTMDRSAGSDPEGTPAPSPKPRPRARKDSMNL
jgi:hypothetical protein